MKTVMVVAFALATALSPAWAVERDDMATGTPALSVRHADLDLSDPLDAQAMLQRLKRAASTVCAVPEIDRPSPTLRRQMEDCKQAALADAVTALSAPAVTRLYDAQTTTVVAYR